MCKKIAQCKSTERLLDEKIYMYVASDTIGDRGRVQRLVGSHLVQWDYEREYPQQ